MQIVKIQHKDGVHQREKIHFWAGNKRSSTRVRRGTTETSSDAFSWLQISEAAVGREIREGRLCSCWWRPEWACGGGGVGRWGRPGSPAGSRSAGAGIPGAWRGRTQIRWRWSWPCFYQGRRKGGRWLTVWTWERQESDLGACSKWNTI